MDIFVGFGCCGHDHHNPFSGVEGMSNPSNQGAYEMMLRDNMNESFKDVGYREGWPDGKGTISSAGSGIAPGFE